MQYEIVVTRDIDFYPDVPTARWGARLEIGRELAKATHDGRAYVVQHTESRDGDTLTITATVLLARIEDAEVGEFAWVQFPALSGVDMGFYMQDFSTGELIPGKKFERVSDAAWKRVE